MADKSVGASKGPEEEEEEEEGVGTRIGILKAN
jgi:hypothetical protein